MYIMDVGHAGATMISTDQVGFSCFCSWSLSDYFYHIIFEF